VLTHPLIVHFPIALWMTAAFFDVLGWRRPEAFYRQAAWWLVGLGLVGAGVSIAFGWVDLLAQESQGVGPGILLRHRTHSFVAYAATVIFLVNFIWRWRSANRPGTGVVLLSVAGATLIAVTGFLGGEMRQVM